MYVCIYNTCKFYICRGCRGSGGRKKNRKAFSERIVALLSTNRWQTCVHQRAAYRPPLTCLPPPQPYCKIWIAEVYNTPPREQVSPPLFSARIPRSLPTLPCQAMCTYVHILSLVKNENYNTLLVSFFLSFQRYFKIERFTSYRKFTVLFKK